jgi:predicted metalloendopeptidase
VGGGLTGTLGACRNKERNASKTPATTQQQHKTNNLILKWAKDWRHCSREDMQMSCMPKKR